MVKPAAKGMRMLLLEPETLLRRTVAMTARTLGVGNIYEAGSAAIAERMLQDQEFHGAVIALDFGPRQFHLYDLGVIDQLRAGATASDPGIPVAVMAESCDAGLLQALRDRKVNRVILKPFRARVLLDTFAEFAAGRK